MAGGGDVPGELNAQGRVACCEEETDLGFLDFGGTKRHPRGTKQKAVAANENAPDITGRGRYENMERETGFEPATLSLGS